MDPSPLLVSCGMPGIRMESLNSLSGPAVDLSEAQGAIVARFEKEFGTMLQELHIREFLSRLSESRSLPEEPHLR